MLIILLLDINMKNITLNKNNTIEHVWIKGVHNIPSKSIKVADDIVDELLQNRHSKAYDIVNKKIIGYAQPFDIASEKLKKKSEIRNAFKVESKQPVTVNSIVWNGGYNAAVKKDAAKRMAELAGKTAVILYDISNNPHKLSLLDAEAVILQIGIRYQALLAEKQSLMVQVDSLPVDATQTDIDAIISFLF